MLSFFCIASVTLAAIKIVNTATLFYFVNPLLPFCQTVSARVVKEIGAQASLWSQLFSFTQLYKTLVDGPLEEEKKEYTTALSFDLGAVCQGHS